MAAEPGMEAHDSVLFAFGMIVTRFASESPIVSRSPGACERAQVIEPIWGAARG